MKNFIWMLFMVLACVACKSDYEKMVDRETAKVGKQDSLFLGITFGMTSKEFFGQCWQLNKEGLVRQGSKNMTVLYQIKEFENKASMNFYPIFVEDTIREMPVTVTYDAWAPWNKKLCADSLMLDVLPMLERWHGKGFLKMEHPDQGTFYVKQDLNRRIAVLTDKDRFVNIVYTDMSVDVKSFKEKVKAEGLERLKKEREMIQQKSEERNKPEPES